MEMIEYKQHLKEIKKAREEMVDIITRYRILHCRCLTGRCKWCLLLNEVRNDCKS